MYSDALVISAFLPINMLTFFAIANSLTHQVRSIVGGLTQIFTPMSSVMKAHGQSDELRQMFLKGARYATLIILPIVITFMLRGNNFIRLWMGERYADPAGHVLWVLSLSVLTQGGYGIVISTMLGLNRHKGLAPFFVIEAAINLGLSIWLVQHYGIVGVAWGTTIPRMTIALLAGPWYARRTLGIGIISFWLNAWIIPMLSMLPFVIGTYVAERTWPASNLLFFFFQVAAVLPLAALGAWFFCLPKAERASYQAAFVTRLEPLVRSDQ